MSRPRGERSRRTWPQRLLITFNALAVLAAALTAGALAYSNDRVGRIERNVFREGVLATDDLEPGDPQNYLIVGVDDASGLAPDDDVTKRPAGHRLTDTIMVLRVDPSEPAAELLSFPRDLYIPIPGSGEARINEAFQVGGPELLVRTIDANFRIPVHHYVEVDFAGFRELVEVVGGVPVHFPHPVRSRSTTELEIPDAGCWVLGPRQALAFARVRKDYQVQDAGGRWHTDLGGDYSRIERQQLFVRLALRRAVDRGARNLNTMRRLLDLGVASVRIDQDLDPEALVDLGRSFRSFDPDDLVTHTLPVDEAPLGGPAYLFLREEEAEPTLARFRGEGGSMVSVVPSEVVVQVRNGTGTPRQATDVTAALGALGFATLVPGPDTGTGYPTVVQYGEGGLDAARLVGSHLGDEPLYQQVDDLPSGVDVLVRTGAGWPGVVDAARPLDEVDPPPTTAPAEDEGTGEGTADGGAEDEDGAADEGDPGSDGPPPTTAPTEAGDPDDPRDDAFYRAEAPPPGADCRPTP